ncbi:MAG: CpcT/CpeT family chromophore lyase [Pseudomonadota bacterium]
MRALLIGLLGLGGPAMAQTATEMAYLETSLGTWSTKAQSVDEAYDWVGSQKWQVFPNSADGVWIYQENAIYGANPEVELTEDPAPYFQVVVHFRDLGDGLLHTTTYRVADRPAAQGFSGGEVTAFDKAWLGEIACMGEMQRVGAGFWHGRATCPNGYKGGVKVESRSVLSPGHYVNWDRGFNAMGQHIWGPSEGGYIFNRVEGDQ